MMKKKRIKKIPFKVGDNGKSYLIDGNPNEEYLLGDLVKF
jgi:hypothetical protein